MCDIYPDGVAEVWTQSHPRARKQHWCHCCSRAIEPGQKYTRTFLLHEGEAYDEKLCAPCARTQTAFGKEHHYYPGAEELEQYLEECVAEDGARKWRRHLAALVRRRESTYELKPVAAGISPTCTRPSTSKACAAVMKT